MNVRAGLVERLQRVMADKGYTVEQVAQRAGLKTPRTVQRVLSGETCSLETLEAIERGLRISLLAEPQPAQVADSASPMVVQNVAERFKTSHEKPIVGWRQAALVLDVSRATLWRHRRTMGAKRVKPWWPSVEACRAWWARIVAGEDG